MASYLNLISQLISTIWLLLPIYLLIHLNVSRDKRRALCAAITWVNDHSLLMVEIDKIKFSCGRGTSKVWFFVKDVVGNNFEICLKVIRKSSLPFKKYESNVELLTKRVL